MTRKNLTTEQAWLKNTRGTTTQLEESFWSFSLSSTYLFDHIYLFRCPVLYTVNCMFPHFTCFSYSPVPITSIVLSYHKPVPRCSMYVSSCHVCLYLPHTRPLTCLINLSVSLLDVLPFQPCKTHIPPAFLLCLHSITHVATCHTPPTLSRPSHTQPVACLIPPPTIKPTTINYWQ